MNERRYHMDTVRLAREMRGLDPEDFHLQEALRPSTLHLELENAGAVTPDPVLVTYKGKTSGRSYRATLYPGGEL